MVIRAQEKHLDRQGPERTEARGRPIHSKEATQKACESAQTRPGGEHVSPPPPLSPQGVALSLLQPPTQLCPVRKPLARQGLAQSRKEMAADPQGTALSVAGIRCGHGTGDTHPWIAFLPLDSSSCNHNETEMTEDFRASLRWRWAGPSVLSFRSWFLRGASPLKVSLCRSPSSACGLAGLFFSFS